MVVTAKTANKLIRIREFHIDYVGHAHWVATPAESLLTSGLKDRWARRTDRHREAPRGYSIQADESFSSIKNRYSIPPQVLVYRAYFSLAQSAVSRDILPAELGRRWLKGPTLHSAVSLVDAWDASR
jgi:hypothetical protein